MAFATLAQLREYLPQVPEWGSQLVTVTGSPTGGTFTLTYDGTATSAIAYNATAATVQTALRAIAAIGSTGVRAVGVPGGPWRADFQGDLALNAPSLVLGTNSLTGGSSPSVTIAKATDSLLTNCLDRATDLIRQAIRACLDDSSFDYAAYGSATTKIVNGYGSNPYFTLPPHQAGSITTVEYQSATDPVAWTAVATDEWDEEAGRLYRATGWGDRQRYRVTAKWGYGEAPDAIEELCLEAAANLWRSKDKGGFSETIGVEGSGAIRVVAGLNKEQRAQIEYITSQVRMGWV